MSFDLNTIIVVLIVFAVVFALVWAADKYLPIPQPIKGILLFIIIAIGLLWLLNRIGAFAAQAMEIMPIVV